MPPCYSSFRPKPHRVSLRAQLAQLVFGSHLASGATQANVAECAGCHCACSLRAFVQGKSAVDIMPPEQADALMARLQEQKQTASVQQEQQQQQQEGEPAPPAVDTCVTDDDIKV